MPLIIEDGTGVAGASSYVTRAEADAYHAIDAAAAAWGTSSETIRDNALALATRQVDSWLRWGGTKSSRENPLQFPRYRCYDSEGKTFLDSDEIPQPLKDAICEQALAIISSPSTPAPTIGGDSGAIGSISVPDLSVSFTGVARSTPVVQKALNLLLRYGWAPGTSGMVPVRRT